MSRFLFRVVIATLLAASVPSIAAAQAKGGDKEILLFGNVTSIKTKGISFAGETFGGGTNTTGTIFLNVGVFLTDRLELGGGPQFTISSSGGGDTGDGVSTTTGANGFFRFSFTSGAKVAPYVGAEINIQDFSPSGFDGESGSFTDTTFLSATGGVKSYLSERAAMDFKASYGFLANDPGAQQLFSFTVGLTIVF